MQHLIHIGILKLHRLHQLCGDAVQKLQQRRGFLDHRHRPTQHDAIGFRIEFVAAIADSVGNAAIILARRSGIDLEIPDHRCIEIGGTMQIGDNELSEFAQFSAAVNAVENTHDFIVIDTPGSDSYLMRLAHAMADTLVTPLNDSFLDFDVLGTVDPTTYSVTGESHYSTMVREARKQRRTLDGASTDWIVVRNRLSMLGSRNKQLVAEGLDQLSFRLGFRPVDGFAERVVYREFFPRGLTHVTAREEVTNLLRDLKLPLDERGRRRAATRAEWFAHMDKPLETHDLIA
ncbi:MAG: ATPase [Novosphingobium sp. 35-62-5]|nr:MAG: ATPase [Novosphingobium sp. 35-62-5]